VLRRISLNQLLWRRARDRLVCDSCTIVVSLYLSVCSLEVVCIVLRSSDLMCLHLFVDPTLEVIEDNIGLPDSDSRSGDRLPDTATTPLSAAVIGGCPSSSATDRFGLLRPMSRLSCSTLTTAPASEFQPLPQLGGGGRDPRPLTVPGLSPLELAGLPDAERVCVQQYYRLKSLFSEKYDHLQPRSKHRKRGQRTLDGFRKSTLFKLESYPRVRARFWVLEFEEIAAGYAPDSGLGYQALNVAGTTPSKLESLTAAWMHARGRFQAVQAHTKAHLLSMSGPYCQLVLAVIPCYAVFRACHVFTICSCRG
jgi:hypothetical protein